MIRVILIVCLCLNAYTALAGLDIEQYLPPQESDLTEEEQKAQRLAVQAEIENSRRLERKREEAERQAQQSEVARLAARPLPVRLTESRCLSCHTLQNLEANPQTRLGWEITIRRMQWFNDATLQPGEHAVIAAYLAQEYPATGWRRFETVFLFGFLGVIFVFVALISYRLITRHRIKRK